MIRLRAFAPLLLVLLLAVGLAPYALADRPPLNTGSSHNTVVAADTDIFASDLQPETAYPASAYRVTVACITTGSVLNLVWIDGATEHAVGLNSNTALTAGVLYTFTVGASRDYTYNFQVETLTTPVILVQEVQDGAL